MHCRAAPQPAALPAAQHTFPPAGRLARGALCIGLYHLAVHVVDTRPRAFGVQRGDAHGAAAVADEVNGRPAKLVGRLAHHPGEACGLEELVHALMLHQRPVAREVWEGGRGEGHQHGAVWSARSGRGNNTPRCCCPPTHVLDRACAVIKLASTPKASPEGPLTPDEPVQAMGLLCRPCRSASVCRSQRACKLDTVETKESAAQGASYGIREYLIGSGGASLRMCMCRAEIRQQRGGHGGALSWQARLAMSLSALHSPLVALL